MVIKTKEEIENNLKEIRENVKADGIILPSNLQEDIQFHRWEREKEEEGREFLGENFTTKFNSRYVSGEMRILKNEDFLKEIENSGMKSEILFYNKLIVGNPKINRNELLNFVDERKILTKQVVNMIYQMQLRIRISMIEFFCHFTLYGKSGVYIQACHKSEDQKVTWFLTDPNVIQKFNDRYLDLVKDSMNLNKLLLQIYMKPKMTDIKAEKIVDEGVRKANNVLKSLGVYKTDSSREFKERYESLIRKNIWNQINKKYFVIK